MCFPSLPSLTMSPHPLTEPRAPLLSPFLPQPSLFHDNHLDTSWFYAMQDHPSRYGVRDPSSPCTAVGCSNPSRYVWWDHIHLVTSVQQRLANTVAELILHSNKTIA